MCAQEQKMSKKRHKQRSKSRQHSNTHSFFFCLNYELAHHTLGVARKSRPDLFE